jgi:regulator of RNase E activity RraA
MDENGACKFPSEYIDEVIDRASALQKVEAARMEKMAKESDPEEILKIMRGLYD